MHERLSTTRRSGQRGVTLIESLIALVVASLGVLGIIGVQIRTLVDTQAGVSRGHAIRLIEDLAERVQSNPDSLGNLAAYTGDPGTSADCASATCDAAALATYDINQWRQHLKQALPRSEAIIFIPDGGPRQLGVLIGWNGNIYNQNGTKLSGTDISELRAELSKAIPDDAKDNDGNSIVCPADMICHLQYIQPTQRCTPWAIGANALYCPN